MAELVASLESNIIGYALGLPDIALDPFGEPAGISTVPPADDVFLKFDGEQEPTDYTIHEPFGKKRLTALDGGLRHTTLPTLTLMWKAIGITRLANGTTPPAPIGNAPETAQSLKGIYRLVIRALTERKGYIWLNWQRQAFRSPMPDPLTFPSSAMWYKDICRVRLPKWLTATGPDGVTMQEFSIEFCQFGLSGADLLYRGGTPIPPPGAGDGNPGTSPLPYAGGFGVGSFGKGGFGVGSLS